MEGSGSNQLEYYTSIRPELRKTMIGALAEIRKVLFRAQVRSVKPRANLLGMTTTKHDNNNVGVTQRPTSTRR
jgi:hypothetical protein